MIAFYNFASGFLSFRSAVKESASVAVLVLAVVFLFVIRSAAEESAVAFNLAT
jgi:hypothetical protein